MKESKYIHLIHKRLTATLLPAEVVELQEWEAQSAQNRAISKAIERTWQMSEGYAPSFTPDVEAGLRKLKHTIATTPTPTIAIDKTRSRRNWLSIAATITILLIAGTYLWINTTTEIPMLVKQTNSAEQFQLGMADGSTVELNQNSQLHYPETFEASERNVRLKGEAFFDIAKDANRPFRIALSDGQVTVLGTSFNIRNYPDEEQLEVTVKTGKVRFEYGKQQIDLTKGDRFIYNKSTKRYRKLRDEGMNSLAWQTKSLNFRNTPLREVIEHINRYYDMALTVANSAALDCGFTASFNEAPLSEVIESIAASLNMSVQQKNNKTSSLIGGGCK